MVALEAGVDALLASGPLGGLPALRAKSLALTDLFVALVEARCAGHGLALVTPRPHPQRGSQVSFTLPDGDQGYAVVQALIERGVIGDFRSPDVLRFGFAPSYLRFADVWDAVEHLRDVLATRAWNQPRFLRRQAVT
jgi:kynureninase